MSAYLKKIGVINGSKLKRLVIIADNCSGQNKNNCVLKLCCWLVEAGWCGTVVLMFLIKGHTKNEADRIFNLLKAGARGVNIFTEEGLDAAYQKNNENSIALHQIKTGDTHWRGYTEGLGELYRNLESSNLLKNHIFTFGGDGNSNTSVGRQLYRNQEIISYDLRTTGKLAQLSPGMRTARVANLEAGLMVMGFHAR